MSFKISFTDLHHSDLLIECRHISTSTKHDFNVLSKILPLRDFFLFAVLSVTKKSFNYILILLCEYGRGEKTKTIKIKPWSFHSVAAVHAEDEQRFSKANEIRAFHSFDTRFMAQYRHEAVLSGPHVVNLPSSGLHFRRVFCGFNFDYQFLQLSVLCRQTYPKL